MKKAILFFVVVLLATELTAQTNKIDSLTALLSRSKDTTRVIILNELTKALWYSNLDSAAAYNNIALQLADSLSYQMGIAEANRCRGVILNFRGDTASMFYLAKALSIFKELDNKRGIAATLNNQNGFYMDRGQHSKALDVLFESLKLFNELQDKAAIGAVTNRIGVTYDAQNDYAAALDYFLQALAIRREINDLHGVAFTLTRVGDMYFKLNLIPQALDYYQQSFKLAQTIDSNNLMINTALGIGKVYQRLGNYSEALKYFKISLKAEQDYYGKDRGATSYISIGETYMSLKDYTLSLFNFQKAREISSQNNKYEEAIVLHYIGQVYLAQNQYPKALENSLNSLSIAKQLNFHHTIKDASLTLSHIYAAMKDYRKAYDYHLQFAAAKDSLQLEDLNQRLAALQQSFELKNKQTQIDLLNRDKQLQESEITRQKQLQYAFIAGMILFIVLVVVLVSRNRQKQRSNTLLTQQKQEIQNTLSELKSAQSQLIQSEKMASLGELTAGIAHEIQNPLNFVNNFSELNSELVDELESAAEKGNFAEVKKIAKDIRENEGKINHHGKRADAIVKSMLQHSRKNTGQKELTDMNVLCDEYLRLAYHGMRAKDKTFSIKIETDFDPSVGKHMLIVQDIGRAILNLISNAFYAAGEKQKLNLANYEATVSVSTKRLLDKIEIIVKDNGTGITQDVKDKIFQPFFTTKPTGQGTGLGLSLCYDIVRAHGGNVHLETEEGEGSTFTIRLPVG
jgi:signal transduction histidine kinase